MFIGKGFYHNIILACHVTLVNKKNQSGLEENEYNGGCWQLVNLKPGFDEYYQQYFRANSVNTYTRLTL